MKSTRLKQFDYSGQSQAYFLTLRFVHSMSGEVVKALYETLLRLFDKSGFAYDVLVVMPDHVHLVTHKETESAERLSDLVCLLKSKSLYLLKKEGHVQRTFWQRGYYEHVIRNEKDWLEKVQYMIYNPVEAGLAPSAEAYPYLFVNVMLDGATQGRPLREGKDMNTPRGGKDASLSSR